MSWSRLSFKGTPDTFTLTLGYTAANADGLETNKTNKHGLLIKDKTVVEWSSSETESEVLQKVAAAVKDPEIRYERVAVQLSSDGSSSGFWGVVSAASAHHDVQLSLKIETTRPPLQSIEMLKTTGGTISTSLGMGILSALDLGHVTRVRCNEGVGSLWDRSVLDKFTSLRVLNLSHAGLSTLPGIIGTLTSLQELRLVGNHLKILPPEIGRLENLRVLAVDNNELSILPGELRKCAALEEFTLENNRLTSVLLSFGSLKKLKTLHMLGNPLEFLPEIAPCQELRHLSVANLRVDSDEQFDQFNVELLAPTGPSSTINISLFERGTPSDKLRPIFSMMLRRSSGHHPLLAGALRHLAEDPKTRDLMTKQESALQQLILMALNDDSIVVEQTCKTLTLLAKHSPEMANAILDADEGSLAGLLKSDDHVKQRASLGVMAAISLSLGEGSNRLLKTKAPKYMLDIVNAPESSQELRSAALIALGNLAFSPEGKAYISSDARAMDTVLRLAAGSTHHTPTAQYVPMRVKAAAVRALAILGDIPAVSRAVGRTSPQGRGLRILSLDGGGMKGMATVRLLRELESRTGRPIHSLFDLIVGTSTGGLLAVALGLKKFSLDECEHIYKVLGQRVFSKPMPGKEKDETWMEAFYRTFHSKTQHVRAVVVGYKHDASVYETLLKEYCSFDHDARCPSDSLIDTACLDVPKIALVATLASTTPAMPFVFRNYELPAETTRDRERMCFHQGSSKHSVWQAVRASSAAIYYLDDFTCNGEKFQDGAVVANNPGVIALQEACALWPETPIEVFVSIGTGSTPQTRRGQAMSSFMDTGNILIESATNVERSHEALATMAPLIPNLKYFRFNPLDARCRMELDEIDPEKWAVLEEATGDFIKASGEEFDVAAAALLGVGSLEPRAAAVAVSDVLSKKLTLSLHRGLFVGSATPASSEPTAAELAAAACARLHGCSKAVDLQQQKNEVKPTAHSTESLVVAAASQPVPVASPLPAPAVPAAPNVVEVDLGSAFGSVLSWFSPTKQPSSKPSSPRPSTTAPATNTSSPPSSPISNGHNKGESPSPLSHPITLSPGGGAISASSTPTSKQRPLIVSHSAQPPLHPSSDEAEQHPLELLKHGIENALPPVGVVLLALRSCPTGLVMRWDDSFAAVTVPSSEADDIVRRAGQDPASISLSDLFEKNNGEVALGSITMRAISKQYRRLMTGELASVILVHYTSPLAVLDAQGVTELASVWAGKMIFCADVVPEECLAAFSAACALAVVSPQQALSQCAGCSATVLGAFWARVYDDLLKGIDLKSAIQSAEALHPAIDGCFKLYTAAN